MTVGELVAKLSGLPQDYEIFVQSTGEYYLSKASYVYLNLDEGVRQVVIVN